MLHSDNPPHTLIRVLKRYPHMRHECRVIYSHQPKHNKYQADIARETGISKTTMSKYWRGNW